MGLFFIFIMLKFFKKNRIIFFATSALFFALVRHRGYDNDAALYLLQVMNYLQPERFVNDVPFMFGNQDSFSFFSPLVAVGLKLLGVNTGGFVLTFFMLLALVVALTSLSINWMKKFSLQKWSLPTIFAIIVLLVDKTYGSGCFYLPIFEPYLVARVFSEVLIVIGLTFIFDKNRFIALPFFFLATLMHPLMGGWTLPLWLFIHYPKFRIPLLVVSLLAPFSGFLHIGRFDFYPEDWKPLYYTPGWVEFLTYSGLLLFWLSMYQYFKGKALSNFAISLFWVSLIGFYLQFAGAYSEHLLFYQAQPFRVQWLCTIPVIPVFVIYILDKVNSEKLFMLRDYLTMALGLCTIAEYQWVVLLIATLVTIYSSVGKIQVPAITSIWIKVLFILSLSLLLINSILGNFVTLTLEQGIGNMNITIAWLNVPNILDSLIRILLMLIFLVCLHQKKNYFAIIFAISFCNFNLKILPIIGIILLLTPSLRKTIRNVLMAFGISFSFIELLNSTYQFNSTVKLPLEGAPITCIILFIILFILSFHFFTTQKCLPSKISLLILILSLGSWDIYRWDSRSETTIINEKQMDSFFEQTIFPQVNDRGKILFAVDYEAPIQSRINFMTGAYADESIYVGEVFYREQFHESNRRRSALLRGDDKPADMTYFKEQVTHIYSNPDTLLSRVRYLCGVGEITHFATDYGNMPLPRQDSVFLNVKQKFVWLYGCPTSE